VGECENLYKIIKEKAWLPGQAFLYLGINKIVVNMKKVMLSLIGMLLIISCNCDQRGSKEVSIKLYRPSGRIVEKTYTLPATARNFYIFGGSNSVYDNRTSRLEYISGGIGPCSGLKTLEWNVIDFEILEEKVLVKPSKQHLK